MESHLRAVSLCTVVGHEPGEFVDVEDVAILDGAFGFYELPNYLWAGQHIERLLESLEVVGRQKNGSHLSIAIDEDPIMRALHLIDQLGQTVNAIAGR